MINQHSKAQKITPTKNRRQCRFGRISFSLFQILFVGSVFGFTILFYSGCGQDKKSEPTGFTNPPEKAVSSPSETPPSESNPSGIHPRLSRTADGLPELEKDPLLDANDLFRKTVNLYSKCKVYSDNAYFEILYDINGPNGKERTAHRYPCSVTLKKPNQGRIAVRDGELISDGKNLRTRIHQPAFEDLYQELKAPYLFSSVIEFYPDIRLASAMQLDVPPTVCWAPPQLIFLQAKKPLKTFLPPGAQLSMLDPAYAKITPTGNQPHPENIIPCDRIQIVSDGGKTTFWISRKDHLFVRIEFPLEQLAVPDNVNRISKINLEIPDPFLSNDLQSFKNDKIFTLDGLENLKKVHEFLPADLVFLGKPFPKVKFKSLITGFSDLNTANPDDKYRLIWLFDQKTLQTLRSDYMSSLSSGGPSKRLLNEFNNILATFGEEPQLQIIPVCADNTEQYSDRLLLSQYGNLNLATPLYRLDPENTDKITISQIPVPSFILVDNKGIVQRFYRPAVNRFRFQIDMKNLVSEQDLFKEDLNRFQGNIKMFREILRQADLNDLYRIVSDSAPSEPEIKPKSAPRRMKLQQIWRVSRLHDPGNPLFIPAKKTSGRSMDLPAEKLPPAKPQDHANADNKTAKPQTGAVKALTDLPSGKPTADSAGQELILVPSDGNNINILSLDGKILRTLDSTVTGDEPITFLRYAETPDGKRFYAASAFLETRKVHCFDENFHKIVSINVGSLNNQRVSDLLLVNIAGNSEPELILALNGDTTDNNPPIDGLYAVDIRTRSILWKDEEITAPYRLGLETLSDGKKNLLAMNHYEGISGNIVVNDLQSGKRLRSIPSGKNESQKRNFSILWLGRSSAPGSEKEAPVFMDQLDIAKSFLAGISTEDGSVLWRTPLTENNLDRRMERIVSGDINGDGSDEWILPYRDGTILIFDKKGLLLDKFQTGSEVTGVCVVRTAQKITVPLHKTDNDKYQSAGIKSSSDSEKPSADHSDKTASGNSGGQSGSSEKLPSVNKNEMTTLLVITDLEGVTAWKVKW